MTILTNHVLSGDPPEDVGHVLPKWWLATAQLKEIDPIIMAKYAQHFNNFLSNQLLTKVLSVYQIWSEKALTKG